MKAYRREKRRERKKRGRWGEDTKTGGDEAEAEEETVDPEMAAMMGFSGFGGTKKKAT